MTTMSRSAADATRFTATGPHASSAMSSSGIKHRASSSSTINVPEPPENETPAQKVVRLREAARRAKQVQLPLGERVLLKGRTWADRAHKVTASGLIVASVVFTGFAIITFTDMAVHNRRKKREWFDLQQANYEAALLRAREAEAAGTLTDDLAMFLNKERALEQVTREKKENKGAFRRWIQQNVFSGLAKEDKKERIMAWSESVAAGELSAHASDAQGSTQGARILQEGSAQAVGRPAPTAPLFGEGGGQEARDPAVGAVVLRSGVGGPLDQFGENAAASLKGSSKSLYDWIMRR